MSKEDENIDPANREGLQQRRKEYAELTEELRLLSLNYESAAAAMDLSADYLRNMGAKYGKPTNKAIASLRRYIDIQKKVHAHFRGELPNSNSILQEDSVGYSLTQEMFTEMYNTLEYLKADTDRRLIIEVNGNESMRQALEETLERGADKRRQAFLERFAKSQREWLEKKSANKPTGQQQKNDTTPPSNGGNNEPA